MKKKAVLSNRIYLTRTEELNKKLREELTYKIPNPKPMAPPITLYDVGRVNNNILTVPIGRTDLIPSDYEIVDKRTIAEYEWPEFKASLREDQQAVYDEIDDNYIINANTGFGKTFTALAIAAKLGQKTLIITHTVALRDQWAAEVEKVYGIKPGIIGSGTLDFDAPICVSNTQTLGKHADKLTDKYGTILIDECHHVPANSFKKIVDKFKARYKIGLSATLRRKDQRHVQIFDFISKKIVKPEQSNKMTPSIVVVNSGVPLQSNPMIPWPRKINTLMAREDYRDLVVNLAKAQAELGHKVLVVADRTDFLEHVSNRLPHSICVTGTVDVDRDDAHRMIKEDEADILCATMAIYKEGVDIPPLSSLILGTPINNEPLLEQLVGRITRPCKGKMEPVVIDIALTGTTGKKQLTSRLNYYIINGYSVKEI